MTQLFDEKSGLLCFMVQWGHELVTAFISQTAWQARFGPASSAATLLDLYLLHQTMIDAVVTRKLDAGARMPVVLRAGDL